MAMVTYENFVDLATLKLDHPGNNYYVAGTILGPDYPTTEDYRVYKWNPIDTTTPDDDEIVLPTIPHPATGIIGGPGRWNKIAIDVFPQVAADWNASSGAAYILNKPSIPTDPINSDWTASSGLAQILNKPNIPGAIIVGNPNSRSVSLSTAYQATDITKSAIITLNLISAPSITLGGGTTNIGEVRIGTNNSVSSGGGTAVGAYRSSLTGTLVLGVAITMDSVNTITFALPAGWYFAVRQTTGSGLAVTSAFDQSISN